MNAKQYKPLVSILTLVYNHSAFIGQTIDSVLTQTFQDWEWIILDDGSVDGTGAIIKQIEDSRIHYCFQEHAGFDHLTRTYNKALAMCRGDFIALLDGDDYWPEYKLEIQLKSFKDPDAVLSYGECFVTYQEGKKKYYVRLPENPAVAGNDPRGSALKHLLLDKCSISGVS
jgi:glycosyltransferase involved in cell wall biosynthesis